MGTTAISIPEVEVLEELGRGAHSIVYRARRLGRYYAVKIPREGSEPGHPSKAARFLKEAVALARVRHPALPSVMEVGETERFPFIIMELVAGETLAERLRRGPLEPAQTLQLALQLSSALEKIHEAGLVHRDIKPSNILFDSLTTAVRLVDFGFVESAVASNESKNALTLAARRETHDDVEADLRALGAVLFQCATGSVPFVEVDPRPLLERDSGSSELLPSLSADLAAVLRRLILPDYPAYRRAALLVKDLRASEGPGSPSSTDAQGPATSPLVARGREMDRLRSALRASASGQTQVVVVRGKPGSGKTRLVRELLEQASDTHRSLLAQCEQSQREPFGALRRLLEALVADFDELDAAERLRAIARFRSLAAGVEPLLRGLSSRLALVLRDVGTPTGSTPVVSDEALAAFLARLLVITEPRIIVVEDTQWIDAGSRRVLGHLTANDVQRHLLLLTSRDDKPSWPALERMLRTLEVERVWELSLGAFDEDQTGQLIRAYLAADSVDAELPRYVSSVSDGTPLGTLEVLRSMLDRGTLVPHWGEWRFDGTAASNMDLPTGSIELLKRRTEQFDCSRQGPLTLAAVLGMTFAEDLLSRAAGVPGDRLAQTLVEARRAMLIETIGPGQHRFLHDSVREALLARASPETLKALHQQAAEALDVRPSDDHPPGSRSPLVRLGLPELAESEDEHHEASDNFQRLYEVANHYAEGEITRNPGRTSEMCLKAAKHAYRAYDNDLALRFFDVAGVAARAAGTELDVESELGAAEAQLRVGALERGLDRLKVVIARAADAPTRAYAHSRVAWAEMQIDTDRAWAALFDGFRALDRRPPSGTIGGLLVALFSWFWYTVGPTPKPAAPSRRRHLEELCRLNDQASRLASDTAQPIRLLEAALRNLSQAERLGPSSALSRAYLAYAFVLVALGFKDRAREYLSKAERVARETRDPAVYAYSLQVHAAVAAWAGNMREALEIGARSLGEYAQWRELGEYCFTAYCQQQIEAVRGRNLDAWKWLRAAIVRLSKHEGPPMALEFIELSVRASLTALGRGPEAEPLLARLADVTTRPPRRGAVIVSSYGARARLFTECGALNGDFEELVREVQGLGLNPKRVHMEVTEYYVHVAHARVHACLRSEAAALPEKVEVLRRALNDLRLAARIPLLKAHVAAIAGHYHRLIGDQAEAEQQFAAAERQGRSEGAPWVLYSVHRGRAHALRDLKALEAARDQARLAESIATEHGAAHRARWVREEFGLAPRGTATGSEISPRSPSLLRTVGGIAADLEGPRSPPRPRNYLKSLVRIGQLTSSELGLEPQAQAVLAELIEATRAERGVLLMTEERLSQEREQSPEPVSAKINRLEAAVSLVPIGARSATGYDMTEHCAHDPDPFWNLFDSVRALEETIFPAPHSSIKNDRVILGVPLFVRGEQFGAIFLDRSLRLGGFSDGDARAFAALAVQVPLVFELARTLRARELAEETQRSTEKLEAIGRLAGGIAHDFNNMLSVILAVSDQILTGRTSRSLDDDVRTVQSAAERARDLTRQLLAFSRGQYLRPEVLQLNDLIQRLEPILRQLLVGDIVLQLDLAADLCRVKADPAQMDQVLTNLVVNAKDAMASGGTLLVQTSNTTIGSARNSQRSELPPGRYAHITVKDTGAGMDADTLAKAFEPFFTTKAGGNGLGLPTAYGIVKQSGGHLEVESRLGAGTTFHIFLPATDQRASFAPPPLQRSDRPGSETVLLVDDEPLVREATRRTLRSLGYKVIGAKSATEALTVAADEGDSIDLVITDVMMPGMNGLELARELGKIRPALKVLFISGFTSGVLAERGFLSENLQFLQKPVAREALASRIRELLDTPDRAS